MKIIFRNLADDIDAVVFSERFREISISKSSDYVLELDEKELVFSLRYNRKFEVNMPAEKSDMISDWLDFSIDSAIVQIENTYCISNLIDGDVIELNDKWHYVPTTKFQSFFRCLPSIYYFGEVECKKAKVEIVSSYAFNREEFLKLYKRFFILINFSAMLAGFVKYKVQMKRQKSVSSQEFLTKKFKELYELPYEEREYQFQPIIVVFDRIADALMSKIKLPKKLNAKLEQKINSIKTSIFSE